VQSEIQDAAYRAQQAIDTGAAIVVGVNRFADETPADVDVFRVDPEMERRQIERVRAVRASRSEQEWRVALAAVERAARDGGNLVPPIVAAVETHATLGEIADTMRGVFGEYQDPQ
jgi:methylmalonyl-CoA mutase N-terminal domain/subunit